MEFPESVLTKNKKGELEVRALVEKGSYVLYNYLDLKTLKALEKDKKSLILKDEDGNQKHFFIIPVGENKNLFFEAKEKEVKNRSVWNLKEKKAEEV